MRGREMKNVSSTCRSIKKRENEKNIKIVVIETIIRRQIKGNSGRLPPRRSPAAYTRISFRPELRFLKRVHPLLVLRGFKSYVPDADTQPENEWPFHDLETPRPPLCV